MDELQLYHLFKLVAEKSPVIKGGFHVLENSGNDLNTNSFDNVVKGALESIVATKEKYPVAVMFPPTEVLHHAPSAALAEWSLFKINMYFLTKSFSENATLKQRNTKTNTSDHSIKWDWKDMRDEAQNFLARFEAVVPMLGPQVYVTTSSSSIVIKRYSEVQNDRLSGVSLSFDVKMAYDCVGALEISTVDDIVSDFNKFISHKSADDV